MMNGSSFKEISDTSSSAILFVTKPSLSLLCPICHEVCHNPVITHACHHSYCRSCIVKSLEYESYCPLCRRKLNPEGRQSLSLITPKLSPSWSYFRASCLLSLQRVWMYQCYTSRF
ncbi:hypothetical protein HMI54_009824 [Coelomomyces lativittatus]|nr:hypothetical protein HMI54_009824 [Coelomomyces lativittatus]